MTNSQKYPPLQALAEMQNNLIDNRLAIKGKQLPCYVVDVDNQFVTVHFDMLPDGLVYPEVKIPIMGWEYIRIPVQKGDKGFTLAADASLRNVSKQGGVSNRSSLPSLTPLVFVPIANTQWSKENGGKVVIIAPTGSIIKTKDGSHVITVDSNKIEVKTPDTSIVSDSSGVNITASNIFLNGTVHINGPVVTDNAAETEFQNDIKIQGIKFTSHAHPVSGVESGSSTVISGDPQ